MKALVTGGSGFLGRYLIRELLKQGYETIAFDRAKSGKSFPPNPGLSHIKGDIQNLEALGRAMDGCDLVFHTAAIADLDEARKKPVDTMEVNVVGTAKCLEAARRAGVKRFLYASSVYTSGRHGSFYRVSKQAGESLCRTYQEEFQLPYTILRYGSLYGREPNHWNFIYSLCREILTKGEYTYASPPNSVREYIHIQDAARETVRIATDPRFENLPVLITGHQRVTVKQLFDMIQEIVGHPISIHYIPAERTRHYIMTPYSLETEIPIRVNLSTYVDINEGILDCLREVQKELEAGNQKREETG